MTIEQLLLLFDSEVYLWADQVHSVLGILRLHGVAYLGDLRDGEFLWRMVVSFRMSHIHTRQGDDFGLT